MFLICRMKGVMIFLVLSMVVLMAEPGDCFFKKVWGRIKAVFKGAKAGWKSKVYVVVLTSTDRAQLFANSRQQ